MFQMVFLFCHTLKKITCKIYLKQILATICTNIFEVHFTAVKSSIGYFPTLQLAVVKILSKCYFVILKLEVIFI